MSAAPIRDKAPSAGYSSLLERQAHPLDVGLGNAGHDDVPAPPAVFDPAGTVHGTGSLSNLLGLLHSSSRAAGRGVVRLSGGPRFYRRHGTNNFSQNGVIAARMQAGDMRRYPSCAAFRDLVLRMLTERREEWTGGPRVSALRRVADLHPVP